MGGKSTSSPSDRKCLEGVLKCLEGVWICLEGVWICLEGVCNVPKGVWKVSKGFLNIFPSNVVWCPHPNCPPPCSSVGGRSYYCGVMAAVLDVLKQLAAINCGS